jgi:hypothetical protein
MMDNFFGLDDSQYWHEPDFLLGLLVSLMGNKLNSEFGITLMLKGMVITGTLVSEREYLHQLNDMFQKIMRTAMVKPSEDDLKVLEDAFNFDDMTEDMYPSDTGEDEDDDEDDAGLQPIRHLHLREPFILTPGAAMTFSESPLPIVRLRLTAVDGWLPGRITVVDPMTGDDDDDDFAAPFPAGKTRIRQ